MGVPEGHVDSELTLGVTAQRDPSLRVLGMSSWSISPPWNCFAVPIETDWSGKFAA
jgi:hypothetical protein